MRYEERIITSQMTQQQQQSNKRERQKEIITTQQLAQIKAINIDRLPYLTLPYLTPAMF